MRRFVNWLFGTPKKKDQKDPIIGLVLGSAIDSVVDLTRTEEDEE